MSKDKTQPAKAEETPLSPLQVVQRVLGCGTAEAEGVVRRMAGKANELPVKYASKEARAWIQEHNVSKTAPDRNAEKIREAGPEAAQTAERLKQELKETS